MYWNQYEIYPIFDAFHQYKMKTILMDCFGFWFCPAFIPEPEQDCPTLAPETEQEFPAFAPVLDPQLDDSEW